MTTRERKRKAAIARIVAVHVESHQRLLALQDALKFLDRPLGVRWTEEELKRIEEIKDLAHQPQRGRSYRASAPKQFR